METNGSSKRKSSGSQKSRIYEPTASNKASMKALGEQIAMRAEKEDVSVEELAFPERSLEECLRTLSPIEANSRLLVSTQATLKSEYHKTEEPKSALHFDVAPLPPSSHLLAPTAASRYSAFHPPTPPEQTTRTLSPARVVQVSSRLTAFNAVRKAAAYEKKEVEVDPREKGWDTLFHINSISTDFPTTPEASNRGHNMSPGVNSKRYKHVKSKLQTPTTASKMGQWNYLSSSDSPCKVNSDIQTTPPNAVGSCHPQQSAPRSNSRGRYGNVSSRLHRPTVASESCKYHKPDESKLSRSMSPAVTKSNRSSSPNRTSSPSKRSDYPSVATRSTAAQKYSQRSKFVRPPDDADVANYRTKRRPHSGRGRSVVIDPSTSPPIRSITQIRSQIKSIMDNDKAGYVFNDFLLDQLIDELHAHPRYSDKKVQRQSVWRHKFMPRAQKSLERMLCFIPPIDKLSPPDGKTVNLFTLVQDGLSRPLAERILSLKCLWLLRMDPRELALLSLAQLKKLTATALTDLDMVEVCALYAVLPHTHDDGEDGEMENRFHESDDELVEERVQREAWQTAFEKGLQHLLEQEHDHALPPGRVRATVYMGQCAVYGKEGECLSVGGEEEDPQV